MYKKAINTLKNKQINISKTLQKDPNAKLETVDIEPLRLGYVHYVIVICGGRKSSVLGTVKTLWSKPERLLQMACAMFISAVKGPYS